MASRWRAALEALFHLGRAGGGTGAARAIVIFTAAESDDDVDNLAANRPWEVSRLTALRHRCRSACGVVLALQATVISSRRCRERAPRRLRWRHVHALCPYMGGAQPPVPPPISDPIGLYDVFLRAMAPSTGDTNKVIANMCNDKNKPLHHVRPIQGPSPARQGRGCLRVYLVVRG
ncbi:hypothetical protein PR202_ga24682 [Eleusine coracana subsp. coracana]|uniref:Uncharacterized protein n=1 Tax=Eleusine coracana subsp. coracana TaxID=191504 RepID=A0AAV5D9R3_ELECO|nr:hypothetical protein PR202_ga24682 [Eleusine coracana subsp. coracana]